MEVSGHLHNLTALPQGKGAPCPLNRGLIGPHSLPLHIETINLDTARIVISRLSIPESSYDNQYCWGCAL